MHSRDYRPRNCILFPMLVITLLATASGCGDSKGNVTGKVELEGKKITSGTVTVFGSDGIPYSSPIDSSGSYVVKNVPVGKAKIALISPDPRLDKDREGKILATPEQVKNWIPLATRYSSSDSSGLWYEVTGGENTFNIDLKK